MIKDMTVGKPSSVLLRFTVPMLISVAFQQIYNIADTMIAGQVIGQDAVAAIGASYPITMIFMAFAFGTGMGASVVISHLFGSRELVRLKSAIYTALLSMTGLAVIMTVAGCIFAKDFLLFLITPENVFNDALTYLNVYTMSMFFLFLYNMTSGIFTALGDSKIPLYFLIGSSIGNIILDYIFSAYFHWGVAGLAVATAAAQGVAGVFSTIVLLKRLSNIHTEKKTPLFSGKEFVSIWKIAIPSILQQSFVSVGNLLIQGLINSYGSDVMAGYSTAIKLNTFCIMLCCAISNAVSSFTAQNNGASRPERIRSGFKAGLIINAVTAVAFSVIYFFFARYLLLGFIKEPTEAAVTTGCRFMLFVAPFYIAVATKLVADGVLKGMAHMNRFMIATFTDLILRVILAFIFEDKIGTDGIWLSWSVGWCISSVMSVIFVINVLRKNDKTKTEAQA